MLPRTQTTASPNLRAIWSLQTTLMPDTSTRLRYVAMPAPTSSSLRKNQCLGTIAPFLQFPRLSSSSCTLPPNLNSLTCLSLPRKWFPYAQTIVEMCWTQPPSPLQTNNSTAAGVTNNKMVSHQTKAMDMRFSLVALPRHQRQITFLLGPRGTELGQLQHQASTVTVPRVPPIYLRWLIPACPSYLWAANPANYFSPLFI